MPINNIERSQWSKAFWFVQRQWHKIFLEKTWKETFFNSSCYLKEPKSENLKSIRAKKISCFRVVIISRSTYKFKTEVNILTKPLVISEYVSNKWKIWELELTSLSVCASPRWSCHPWSRSCHCWLQTDRTLAIYHVHNTNIHDNSFIRKCKI